METVAQRDRRIRYRMSAEQYDTMLDRQGGVCAICLQPRPLHVDHCHKTKLIRGLLCQACNTALGKMEDDVDRLTRAVAYLQTSGEVGRGEVRAPIPPRVESRQPRGKHLDREVVVAIFNDKRHYREVAADFGVSSEAARRIQRGLTHKNLLDGK